MISNDPLGGLEFLRLLFKGLAIAQGASPKGLCGCGAVPDHKLARGECQRPFTAIRRELPHLTGGGDRIGHARKGFAGLDKLLLDSLDG